MSPSLKSRSSRTIRFHGRSVGLTEWTPDGALAWTLAVDRHQIRLVDSRSGIAHRRHGPARASRDRMRIGPRCHPRRQPLTNIGPGAAGVYRRRLGRIDTNSARQFWFIRVPGVVVGRSQVPVSCTALVSTWKATWPSSAVREGPNSRVEFNSWQHRCRRTVFFWKRTGRRTGFEISLDWALRPKRRRGWSHGLSAG